LKNWENYYNTIPLQVNSDDYLRQVGKTIAGKTIDNSQFDLIVNSIIKNLKINSDDIVLDLCCGNGLITQKILQYCDRIEGIDYSKPLIDIAKSVHSPDYCNYLNKSILDLHPDNFPFKFSKVYMYEALQHFSQKQFEDILQIIFKITKPQAIIFLGSIPNKEKIWDYYNTFSRKLDYIKRKIINSEAIGYWWNSNSVLEICNKFGMKCTVMNQNPELYTTHYRFDALIQIDRN